ncbi:DUF998 domain-containing protein [Streptosporangium sp. NPDC005286]|uniref:DUF998 domain-containing protein n=1 Tax=Streptosporangium sp. NPDC005286 TaxID=3154463 RepID=UPI0033A1D7E9
MSNVRKQRLTRALLTCGAVAGPLFILAVVIQDYTRVGFDPRRQPLSMLSLGDLGWIQIANFVITGLLNIAFAVGLWRALRPGHGGTWGPLLIGAYGTGLVGAGVFRFEPAWGYPPGAPQGPPDAPGLSYILHGAAFGVGFVSLVAACFVFTRHFAVRGERGWALYCAATGVALPALYLLAGLLSDDGENSQPLSLLLRAIALLGWGWAAVLAVRVRGSHTPAGPGVGSGAVLTD